ncbi:MAG: tetratricopeptide repeat protein [Bacteroidetes bacterium]|nr:tetratricopeptide repeat protein [Bacteroidota bacterium]
MERSEVERRYNQVCDDVYHNRIKAALDRVGALIRNTNQSNDFYELENVTENYQNLLKYAYEGYKDPDRKEILKKIAASVLSLADDVRFSLSEKEYPERNLERRLMAQSAGDDPQALSDRLEELLSEKVLHHMLEETGTTPYGTNPVDSLFRLIWLSRKIKDTAAEKIRKVAQSADFEVHEKCLVVSALTISLLDFFDAQKILLLMEFVRENEKEVYQRALTGLVLGLIWYDRRIMFYPEIMVRLDELSQDEGIQRDMEALLLQLLMARETETIVKAFEEEVLPEMKKMAPKFEDKLELENIFGEEDLEGKNPDWKEMIDEVPGLFERIEKFTKMQMEGGDVFLSTFSQLKRFDFFTRMSNWFIPFYADHPELKSMDTDEGQIFARLLEGLGRAFYLCNSDKYSFALNFNAVPQQQRSMIMTYFEAELEQMKEMASEEEILDPAAASNSVFIQYIQDLYRFFKLYPFHNEFNDIFQKKIRFSELYFYRNFFERENFTARLAAFYLDKEHYPEAIDLYGYLLEKDGPNSDYFEKIGYSYQKMKRYANAIEYYRKAELFDSNRLWILKKLGWCSLKIRDYANALKYFEGAALLQPDDLGIQARIGHCQLSLKNFGDALSSYSKVIYYQPDNLNVLRPVAYCQFVLGKLDAAEESCNEVLSRSDAPSPFDLMNLGHVMLCRGKRKEALEAYKKSKSTVTDEKLFSTEAFQSAFEQDIPHLIKNGVPEEELPLILDYLLIQTE